MDSVDRFLIIDDSESFRASMRAFIKKFYPESTIDEYQINSKDLKENNIDPAKYDVLFLDYDLGDFGNGLDWYKEHKKNSDFPATIMLTGAGNERIAVKAIRIGIHEYLSKEALSRNRLSRAINNAVEAKKEEVEKELSMTQVGTTFNKGLFFNRLENASNGQLKQNTTLILILLDAHEALGKTWGLLTRDNIIRHITKLANQFLRPIYPDLNITRYGDQYVAILLGETHVSQQLDIVLSDLCKQYSESLYKEKDTDINFTVSIGAVPLKNLNMDANEVISLGLNICNEKQTETGNSFHIHIPDNELEKSTITEKPKENFDVVAAIKEDRVVPYFQQIVPLADDNEQTQTDIYEVRTHFIKTDGNLLEGSQFNKIIKNKKVLEWIDKWLIRMMIGKLLRLENSIKTNEKYAIKLTGHSLSDPKFMFWIMELLKKNKFRKTSLLIEIDANDFLKHTKQVSALIEYMRNVYNFECVLSPVNDFKLLKLVFNKEKFEYIKLDAELTKHLSETDEESEKIDSIIDFTHQSDSRVIVTWVEDSKTLYAAHNKKVDLIQGNFVSPPREEIEGID